MTKGLWVYCPSPMFLKSCTCLYFYILSHLFSFWNNFPPPPHLLPFFLYQIPPTPFPQILSAIRAVPSSGVFCSNVVLITPSSSMHFFSFFDVLPSATTTTGMTLMLPVFHILLISLFSSWYLSIISFSFSLPLMRIAISIMVQLLSLLFTTTITGLSVTLDHSISQNLHFFIFNKTFWIMFIPLFTSFQLAFPTQFPMNYSCNIIMPSLVLLLCQLFAFAHNMRYCFTILVTHSTKW